MNRPRPERAHESVSRVELRQFNCQILKPYPTHTHTHNSFGALFILCTFFWPPHPGRRAPEEGRRATRQMAAKIRADESWRAAEKALTHSPLQSHLCAVLSWTAASWALHWNWPARERERDRRTDEIESELGGPREPGRDKYYLSGGERATERGPHTRASGDQAPGPSELASVTLITCDSLPYCTLVLAGPVAGAFV